MANPNLAVRLYPDPLFRLDYVSFTGSYVLAAELINPARILYIVNTTDVLVVVSFDGITDHFVIPSGSYILLDVTSNMTLTGGAFAIAQGQKIYLDGSPTLGEVYISTFYGAGTI